MAKRRKRILPARKEMMVRDDDSLLIRSAESLGRIIGSLQRQVLDRSEGRTATRTSRKSTTRKPSASRKRSGTSRKASKKR
jgi:hypothetical protein